MNVKHVIRDSISTVISKHMKEFIQVKNHMNVKHVGEDSNKVHI